MGVELLKGNMGLPAYMSLPNSEYHRDYLRSESARDNLRGQKGNNPDRLLRERTSRRSRKGAAAGWPRKSNVGSNQTSRAEDKPCLEPSAPGKDLR